FLCFFLLSPRPPCSTLFPYTTLFRSLRVTASDAILEVNQRVINVPRSALQMTPRAPGVWAIVPRPGNALQLPQSWGARYGVCPQDRKSTRLNSSHDQISYAVFCLKKK